MTVSPAMNALKKAGYCPEHIGTAQGEDCPECEIKGLRLLLGEYRAGVAELEATIDRLRQDRLDYSTVTTTEGMNASEWIWRTGKAERRVAELESELQDFEADQECENRCAKLEARVAELHATAEPWMVLSEMFDFAMAERDRYREAHEEILTLGIDEIDEAQAISREVTKESQKGPL